MANRRRKWKAQKQDISVISSPTENKYIVSGSRGIDYRVDLNKHSCNCPDWQKRSPSGGCKHLLHVKLEEGLIDPLPSAKTNFGNPKSRSQSNYPSNWDSLSKQTKERDNWTCQKCGDQGGPYGNATVSAHHMVPKSDGGKDKLDNLITVCHSCHEEEHGHHIPAGSGSGTYYGTSDEYADTTVDQLSEVEDSLSETEDSPETTADSAVVESDHPTEKSKHVYSSENNYKPNSSIYESELPAWEGNSDSESAQVKDSSEIADQISVERSDSELLSSVPKMIEEEQYQSLDSRAGAVTLSLISFAGLGIIGALLSVSQLGWIIITGVSAFFYLFSRHGGKETRKTLDELKEINTEVSDLVTEINNNISAGEEVCQQNVNQLQRHLDKIENELSYMEPHLEDAYLEWVNEIQETLEDLGTSRGSGSANETTTEPNSGSQRPQTQTSNAGKSRRTKTYLSEGLDERQHYEKHR